MEGEQKIIIYQHFMNNKRIPQAPQEVTDLRSKIKKYHKN